MYFQYKFQFIVKLQRWHIPEYPQLLAAFDFCGEASASSLLAETAGVLTLNIHVTKMASLEKRVCRLVETLSSFFAKKIQVSKKATSRFSRVFSICFAKELH